MTPQEIISDAKHLVNCNLIQTRNDIWNSVYDSTKILKWNFVNSLVKRSVYVGIRDVRRITLERINKRHELSM